MIFGNWVAIHKGFIKHLPIDREYSELEAMFSLSVDIDNKKSVSILGYSTLWGWSRNKVKRFLFDVGIEFFYPESIVKKQNQRAEAKGQIMDRTWTDNGQIRYIVDKGLYPEKDRSRTDDGQIKDTTINPDPDPDPKTLMSKKIFDDNSIEMKISKYLFTVLLKSDPNNKKPNFQNWCIDVERMLRIDKRSPEDTKKVINFAHDPQNSTDKFSWIPNLRSPKKLREHFTAILLKFTKGIQPCKSHNGESTDKLIEEIEDQAKKATPMPKHLKQG